MGEIRSSRSHFVRLADAWQINTAQNMVSQSFAAKNIHDEKYTKHPFHTQ
jgi:hypothetical protein